MSFTTNALRHAVKRSKFYKFSIRLNLDYTTSISPLRLIKQLNTLLNYSLHDTRTGIPIVLPPIQISQTQKTRATKQDRASHDQISRFPKLHYTRFIHGQQTTLK